MFLLFFNSVFFSFPPFSAFSSSVERRRQMETKGRKWKNENELDSREKKDPQN